MRGLPSTGEVPWTLREPPGSAGRLARNWGASLQTVGCRATEQVDRVGTGPPGWGLESRRQLRTPHSCTDPSWLSPDLLPADSRPWTASSRAPTCARVGSCCGCVLGRGEGRRVLPDAAVLGEPRRAGARGIALGSCVRSLLSAPLRGLGEGGT